MGSIRAVADTTSEWVRVADLGTKQHLKLSPGELATEMRFHHTGSDSEPELFEVRVPPDTRSMQHAHDNDEIMFVLRGELRVGAHLLGPGSSLFIAAHTLYAFHSGPEGVHFANFRPRGGSITIPKAEFLEQRRASG